MIDNTTSEVDIMVNYDGLTYCYKVKGKHMEKEFNDIEELFQYLDKLADTCDVALENNTRETKEVELDNVNHPTHYNKGTMECLDVIKACLSDSEFKGFLKGNVLKYMYRKGDKGDALEDLNKACWYAKKLMEQEKDGL